MNTNELLEAALNVHSQVDRGIVLPGEALNKVIELIAGEVTKKVSTQLCSETEGRRLVEADGYEGETMQHDLALAEVGVCPWCGLSLAQAEMRGDFDGEEVSVLTNPIEPMAIPGYNAPDRRESEEVYGMPTRAVVLVDIAGAIRETFPLEALMLENMAKSMTHHEDAGHVLFNRRRLVGG